MKKKGHGEKPVDEKNITDCMCNACAELKGSPSIACHVGDGYEVTTS